MLAGHIAPVGGNADRIAHGKADLASPVDRKGIRVDLAKMRQQRRRFDALPGLEPLADVAEELDNLTPGILPGVAFLRRRPVERHQPLERLFFLANDALSFEDGAKAF